MESSDQYARHLCRERTAKWRASPGGEKRSAARPSAGIALCAGLVGALLGATHAHAQPANDNCANAQSITPGVHDFTTDGATNDGTASCGSSSASPDVWFRVVAAESGRCEFKTCLLTSMDTVLSAFDACGGAEIACADDSCGQQTSITVPCTAGVATLFRVAGFKGQTGSGQVMLTFLPEPARVNGVAHAPLGDAILEQTEPNVVQVSNFGPGLMDGYVILPGAVDGNIYFELVIPPLPLGLTAVARVIGELDGLPDQVQVTFEAAVMDDPVLGRALHLTPDYSSQGSPTYSVKVVQNGECQPAVTGLSGPIVIEQPPALSARCGGKTNDNSCNQPGGGNGLGRAIMFFDPPVLVSVGGAAPMMVERVIIGAENPTIPDGPLTSLEVRVTEMPPLTIIDSGIGAFLQGLYRGLAGAFLTASSGELEVSNIGSSGQDGVSVELFDAEYAIITLAPPEGVDPPPGATFRGVARGTVSGSPGREIVRVGADYSLGSFDVFADFSPLGSNLASVQILNKGVVVASFPAMAIPTATITGTPRSCNLDPFWRMNIDDCKAIFSFTPALPISVAGSAPVLGDEIFAISAGTGPLVQYIDEIEMRTTIPGLRVLGETVVYREACPCDWNHDGILNSQDFFDFVNALFSGSADFNNDGVTNSQDFFDFVNCLFSGCP